MMKRLVSQLPWGQIIRLIQMVKAPDVREFYIRECLARDWSRDILEIQIKNQHHLRADKVQNNLHLTMPDDLRGRLPTIEEIEAELSGDLPSETELES